MGCHWPLRAWKSREVNESGKRSLEFAYREGYSDLEVKVPCGKCYGCRLERSREWAVRCVHEASMWERNSYVTLTYNDDNLVYGYGVPTLVPDDFVKFMKRLRHAKSGVRFIQAGEYGAGGRPHHHALLFNCGFDDMVYLRMSPSGERLYRSEELEKFWPFGFSSIGAVSFESAAYVARYTIKKIGEENRGGAKTPEYMTMSRNPGIGKKWLDKYSKDIFPSDEVIVRGGVRCKPPRYYDEYLKKKDLEEYNRIKSARYLAMDTEEQSSGRLNVKEDISRRRVGDFLHRRLV